MAIIQGNMVLKLPDIKNIHRMLKIPEKRRQRLKLQQHGLHTLEGRPKLYKCFQVWPHHKPGGGGRGVLNKCFLWGGFVLRSKLLTLLYTIFHEKGTPFVYPLLTNGTPFTYLVQNFASLLTAVKALSFKQELTTKIERFLDFLRP